MAPFDCSCEEEPSPVTITITEMIRRERMKVFLRGFGIGFVIGILAALPLAFVVLRF